MIPRYIDERDETPVDVALACKCGYAVALCSVVRDWKLCPLCLRKGIENPLQPRDYRYPTVTSERKAKRAR